MTFTVAHFADGPENLRPYKNGSFWPEAALRDRLLSATPIFVDCLMVSFLPATRD